MNHPNTSLVLCGVIAGVVAAAHAESVYVQVQGNDIGRGVVVSLSGGLTFADGSASKTVWELVYDFDGSEQSIDMHQGHIAFGMLDGALFDSMKTTALRGGPGSNLSLLSSDLHTDHFRVVPLPSGASLAGLGLLLAGARRCRRS